MSLHFQYYWLLTALALVPVLLVLFFYLLKWKKATVKKIGEPRLVRELISDYLPSRFNLKFSLILLALVAIILSAANLRKPGGGENVNRKGVDVMMVLDVSKSMLAEDHKPNRLERARQTMIRLMEQMPEDRIGLVLFAGRAYLQMPLTNDHGAGRMFIQEASPFTVPTQGTIIGEALKMANAGFETKEKKFKSIILISDGEDHDSEAIQVATALAENGVMINTIGIGSTEGTLLIDPETGLSKKDAGGNAVISKLNEGILQQIAAISKGIYIKLEDTNEAVTQILNQLRTIEQKSLQDVAYLNYKTFFQWFIGAALILILAEIFISERKKVRT